MVKRVEAHFAVKPSVANRTMLVGFSGQGQNAAQAFVTLKDWAESGADASAEAISAGTGAALAGIPDAVAMALAPPAIDLLGNSSGFSFCLKGKW